MRPSDLPDRLSTICTRWTLVFDAHRDQADEACRAQQALVLRYSGAIYRYLLGMLKDPHQAEDLAQDFAVRLVQGDFAAACPSRGRFRDFVKAALRNLVIDHWRRRRPGQLPEDFGEPADRGPTSDRAFLDRWREELLERAWEGLAAFETESGQPYYTLLRLKADRPELRSAQIALEVTGRLGRAVSETAVRKALQRARERFAELLLDEVARSIGSSSREDIEAELGELDLLTYCRPAVDRYAEKKPEREEGHR
jgi:RNA polymerase sigma-70 factor (ECF subfamily)